MPFNLVSPTSLWIRIKRDTDGTSGDGTTSGSATSLESFNPELGLKADTAATTDTGSFSLIALIKRLLGTKMPDALTASGNFKTAVSEALPAGSNAIGSVSVSASALPTGAATSANQSTANTSLSSIDGKLPALASGKVPSDASLRYTVTNRNGTTSGTPNTWSQLAAANSSRNALFIFNPASNTASIDVGFGGSGSEAVVFTIPPSGTFSASALNGIPTDRVAVRSTGTSVAYYAAEG